MTEQVARQSIKALVPCATVKLGLHGCRVSRTAVTVVQLYTASSWNLFARIEAGKRYSNGFVDYYHVTFQVVEVRETRLAEAAGERGFDRVLGLDRVLVPHVRV